MNTEIAAGTPAWPIKTPVITGAVTVQGAMLGPVQFTLPNGKIAEPLYISPWQGEATAEDTAAIDPPVLQPLRGDFFCCPFGGDNTVGAEHHPPHGEAASRDWTFTSLQNTPDATVLTLDMDYRACAGSVTREIHWGNNAPTILSRTTLSGFEGDYPLGYHATLQGGSEGTWKLYTDSFDIALTSPDATAPMVGGEYYALAPNRSFTSLSEVPSRWKDPETVDCSVFPARPGFVDIFALWRRRAPTASLIERLSWTVAVNRLEQYAWYSIKDASVLPATVFWWEHGGRHAPPWSGRNSCLGIEETCTYFASGRRESIAPNSISQSGIPTAVHLSRDRRTTVWSVQGVIPWPDVDVAVVALTLDAAGTLMFVGEQGEQIPVPFDLRSLGE